MTSRKQMSESIRLGLLLAFSGGFMDAYSYIQRDHVFANAQTGNILLFGVSLSEGDFSKALRYFLPFFAFMIGIMLTELVHNRCVRFLHWRQTAVLIEAVILAGVAIMPLSLNVPANILTSFACGIQVESFRKVRGNSAATTMCIGNMRSGTQNLCLYLQHKNRKFLKHALLYYGIIVSFVLGAVVGNRCIALFREKAILCCTGFLLVSFFMMFAEYTNPKQP